MVVATGKQPATTATTAKPTASAAPKPPRAICLNKPQAFGKKLADVKMENIRTDGGAELPAAITPKANLSWVNLWAGYCIPCKEEIPLLIQWKDKLQKEGAPLDLYFVSIDDDDRLSKRFMDAQPKDGLKSSFHLPEGKSRAQFLTELGLKATPDLPVHVLLDKDGAVTCVIEGAITENDFDKVREIVKKGRAL